MIKEIRELNFPSYATLTRATVSLQDMAERTIETNINIDGDIAPDFSHDWEVEFGGEKYIMPLRTPQGAKSNESILSSIDLTFQHWAIYQLKRWFFFNIINLEAGTTVPDEYDYPITLNLGDFCTLFGKVLAYYYGDKITIDLNPDWEYKEEAEVVSISHSHIWNVLIESFYTIYRVRWQIEPRSDNDNEAKDGERYVIKVGYPTTEVEHIFEYGFEGGLLKVERQVQDDNIRNMIIGRGGEKNLPYRYFKKHDSDNASFSPDRDWIPELKDRYFANLHGATFRSYVQGWKAKHIEQYRKDYPDENWGVTVDSADKAYAPWAWMRGNTDSVFHPVEYVADEYETTDNGYGVKTDSSISKYGELEDGLENNEEIYPTIQGVTIEGLGRIDQVVSVQRIISDDIEDAADDESKMRNIAGGRTTIYEGAQTRVSIKVDFPYFDVDKDCHANIIPGSYAIKSGENNADRIVVQGYSISVTNLATGEEHSASGIPSGRWIWSATFDVELTRPSASYSGANMVTVGFENPKLELSNLTPKWGDTWDIWIKNVWQSERQRDETYEEYAERIWRPIVGDRLGNEAKIVFSSGWLSISEDYEFTLVSMPVYDPSMTIEEKDRDGNVTATYPSHWRLTLAKSDADLESLGLYLPSKADNRQAHDGDYFFFIGIDMPHLYVVEAEKRLDDWKKDELGKVKDIKPTWVVSLDKVRIHNFGKPEAIIDSLHPGDTLTLQDERFIPGSHQEKLYLTSITYTYNEPTDKEANLLPDVEVVLSDDYTVSANPVAQLTSEVSALQKQVGAISNIEQMVRAVGDKLYLRKDGFADRSYSPTEFASLLTSLGFRSGTIGGAGWGFYKDENGNWVLETDNIVARKELNVNTFVINQTAGQGGTIIDSAAQLEITRAVKTAEGYVCYFDQREGSIANLFHVDDVALCQRYTPQNEDLKYYKRRVVAVAVDSVTLSDTEVNGKGIPEEKDVIIQYGNYNDAKRQYIKVRDIIGGGYERYIEGLDSVDSDGVEYFFVGRQIGDAPRGFIGHKDEVPYSGAGDGSYIEYKDRVFNLNNVALSVGSTVGEVSFKDILKDISDSDYLRKAFTQSTDIINGVVLTSLVQLGVSDSISGRTTHSGISGLYDVSKTGGGIALWFGGDMLDKADYFDWDEVSRQWLVKPDVDTSGLRIASGIDRMDGTGYRANGNLWWDNTGKIYADPMSFFVGENTLGSVTQLFLYYPGQNMPFTEITHVEPQRPFKHLRIGNGTDNALISYDSTRGALIVDKPIVSLGDMSAFGIGGDGGGTETGGATALAGLVDVTLSGLKSGQALVYDGTHWVNKEVSTGIDGELLDVYLRDYVKHSELPSLVDYAKLGDLADYLPLAGGTLTGRVTIKNGSDTKITLDNTDADTYHQQIAFMQNGVQYGTLGTAGTAELKWNGANILDTSNFNTLEGVNFLNRSGGSMLTKGLVTNLNADMLDGKHADAFLATSNLKFACMITNVQTPAGYKITTTWPSSADLRGNGMPCINIRGYAYGKSCAIDTDIVVYQYNGFYINGVTHKGAWRPEIYATRENGVAVFYIAEGVNGLRAQVYVYANDMMPQYMQGWSFAAVSDASEWASATLIREVPVALSANATTADKLSKPFMLWGNEVDCSREIMESITIASTERINLSEDKSVWLRYNASLNAIETSHTIVSHGDMAAFSAPTDTASGLRKVVRANATDGDTVAIPSNATDLILNTSVDGGEVKLVIDGDESKVELINIYVREYSAGDVDITFGSDKVSGVTIRKLAIIRDWGGKLKLISV